jgi:1-acyl-sn-glycerol-3-phosphate acyltransferase
MKPWKLEPAHDIGLPPLERLRSPRREAGLVSSILQQGWGTLVQTYMAIWHRLTIHEPRNLPCATPFILVANHTSYLDSLVLAAALPWRLQARAHPLAAGDTFFESPWGSVFAANFLNALPVWRKKHGNRALQTLRQRLLDESCGFILFPEGTRSRDGRMTSFKAGVGMLVAGTNVPVIPCRLSGCFDALPPGRKLPRRKRIDLHIGAAICFPSQSNDKHGWQQVAQALETAVRGLPTGPNHSIGQL